MPRQSFLNLTIEGDDLDPVAIKEAVGLPCEIYYKGQKSVTKFGKEIESLSTRWLYSVNGKGKTESFLEKHLEIISQKLPQLEKHIEKHNSMLELIIYEDNPKKEHITLTQKITGLLNKVNIEFLIVFKDLKAIYGKDIYEI